MAKKKKERRRRWQTRQRTSTWTRTWTQIWKKEAQDKRHIRNNNKIFHSVVSFDDGSIFIQFKKSEWNRRRLRRTWHCWTRKGWSVHLSLDVWQTYAYYYWPFPLSLYSILFLYYNSIINTHFLLSLLFNFGITITIAITIMMTNRRRRRRRRVRDKY